MISFFTPDGSLAESLGGILLHIVIGNDASNSHNIIKTYDKYEPNIPAFPKDRSAIHCRCAFNIALTLCR